MAQEQKQSFFKGANLCVKENNSEHHTDEISKDKLIVRRGQRFTLKITLNQPFKSGDQLDFCAFTGEENTREEVGTMTFFSVPKEKKRSPTAKVVWKANLDKDSSPNMGSLVLNVTPPAETPVGKYYLTATYKKEQFDVGTLVVLFNPWCPNDWVFLGNEDERQEYVMNEHGVIYKGSGNYIFPLVWDFGQFEEDMPDICCLLLDVNRKHLIDPVDDVSARCNPIYVSRVISAMINSEDDRGVLTGRWGGSYADGRSPSHWSGSHAILSQWFRTNCQQVKYGQCWVFAAVMCSVMRSLGIPCRVVTNFESAHDNNANLTIDVYHADHGVDEKESLDSIWNFHVWVEGWMKRPDLDVDGKFDGWQVLDPTPQEMSDGLYCCGPAPVKGIHAGETDRKYDIPFVFAEVNADCVDWLLKKDGSKERLWTDTNRVGQNISTKSIGSDKRMIITDTYKHKEDSEKERAVFKYACTRDYCVYGEDDDDDDDYDDYDDEDEEEPEETEELAGSSGPAVDGGATETPVIAGPCVEPPMIIEVVETELPPLSLEFKERCKPVNGKDVKLNLVVHSKSTVPRDLHVCISVQAMRYNGLPTSTIQCEKSEKTLQPGKDLTIKINVPFNTYKKAMLDCESMKVSAMVKDMGTTNNAGQKTCLAEHDVVLRDPPITIEVRGQPRCYHRTTGKVIFLNPVNETLKNCTLTLSGGGLLKDELEYELPDMKPSTRITVKFNIIPYKPGQKTLTADFDCSVFRDIKGSCSVNIEP